MILKYNDRIESLHLKAQKWFVNDEITYSMLNHMKERLLKKLEKKENKKDI